MKFFLFTLTTFFTIAAFAQEAKTDTIPFETDKLFLIFKGSINGKEVSFAFDTGASSSVSNSTVDAATNTNAKGGKKSVTDANQQTARLQHIKINELTIGSFRINNFKAITYDMPYLNCAGLFLLGQDVIKNFNWQIDFNKKLIYLSKQAFTPTATMKKWDISFKNTRPAVNLRFNNKTYKNCLIDFGFTGIFDINTKTANNLQLYQPKLQAGKVNTYYTSAMGLTGLGTPVKTDHFIIDSMLIENTAFTNVLATMSDNTDSKLGVQFFKNYCSTVIFNFSTGTMYVALKNEAPVNTVILDARVSIKDGQFIITGKNLNEKSTATTLQLGEVIKTVNGKTITDFGNECEFLLWSYQYTGPQIIIEKLTGEKVIIKRSSRLSQ